MLKCASIFFLFILILAPITVENRLLSKILADEASQQKGVEYGVQTPSDVIDTNKINLHGKVMIPNKRPAEVANHYDEDAEEDSEVSSEVNESEEIDEQGAPPGFHTNGILISVAISIFGIGVILYSLYLSKKENY